MRKDVYTRCRTRRSSQSRTWSSGFVQASALQSPTDDAGDFEGQCETRLGGGAAPITNPAQRGRELRWSRQDEKCHRRPRPTAEDAVPERDPRQRGDHPRNQQLARRGRAARADEVATALCAFDLGRCTLRNALLRCAAMAPFKESALARSSLARPCGVSNPAPGRGDSHLRTEPKLKRQMLSSARRALRSVSRRRKRSSLTQPESGPSSPANRKDDRGRRRKAPPRVFPGCGRSTARCSDSTQRLLSRSRPFSSS